MPILYSNSKVAAHTERHGRRGVNPYEAWVSSSIISRAPGA